MKMTIHRISVFVVASALAASCTVRQPNAIAVKTSNLYTSPEFQLLPDRVIQGKFEAVAQNSTAITSNYQSPANENLSPVISFKFSINGKDNEMLSGKDHLIKVSSATGTFTAPLIKFGHQYVDPAQLPVNTFLKPDTKLRLRLDMREVLENLNSKGFYTTSNGNKIYKDDFKGVYVAGSISPFTWDFDNLVNFPGLELKDPDKDGIYELELILNEQKKQQVTAASWSMTRDVSAFPRYKSDYVLLDALYNLSLEEMQNAVEPDSTFRTGKEWAGVWTRDISYSIILSMANLQPKVAINSLMRKVKNNRVIQDTGTGGSYPISSDRMIWAVAAWEVYKNTGDRQWLETAYPIIRNSVEDDLKNVYDESTGLVKGESSFLDWREQSYPDWMQSADIYDSENLGTNAVHYQTNIVLAEMSALLNDQAAVLKYGSLAKRIKDGINQHLWIPGKKYYGQFLYGKNYKILSPRAEALGEALTVLFDIADADRKKEIVENTPVNAFGIPTIYPQIPNIPPYHNNAVWPFVQSYWALAAAKAGNGESVMQSLAAIYRPAAMFLTNKENFVATNGDFLGTQINSSNMLWSLSGNISMVYKVIFGMNFNENSLDFKPFIPEQLKGVHSLSNFRYRDAVLDITVKGYGNKIRSVSLDGESIQTAAIPGNLKGKHSLVIVMDDNSVRGSKTNLVKSYFSPAAPVISQENNVLSWEPVKGAVTYRILKNGKQITVITSTSIPLSPDGYAEYQVIAVDSSEVPSFASEPLQVGSKKSIKVIEMETLAPLEALPYKGFTGKGFIEITKQKNKVVKITLDVQEEGLYALDFRYANGNGPTNTENKCAIRTLKNEKGIVGTFVFPQRGKEEWSDWGYSNPVKMKLEKGVTKLSLVFTPADENMNGEINQAMLDHLRFIKLDSH